MGRAMEGSDTLRHRRSARYSRLAYPATAVCAIIALSSPTVNMAASDRGGESGDSPTKDLSKLLTEQVGERIGHMESAGACVPHVTLMLFFVHFVCQRAVVESQRGL